MINKYKNSIAYRLFLIVLAFSLMLTISITLIRTYLDFKDITTSINNEIEEIQKINTTSIAENLWVMEHRNIQVLLEGLLNRPNIECINILKGNEVIASAGAIRSKQIIQRYYPLYYTYNNKQVFLGTLVITAGLDTAYSDLRNMIFTRLLYDGLSVFSISLFILFIVHAIVTKHLSTIAQQVTKLNPLEVRGPLIIQKRHFHKTQDELDDVVAAINTMTENLRNTLHEMNREIIVRKQAEEELRFKNAVLATQQETTLDGILVVDGKGRILSYNTRFVDLWGIASEIVETKSDERSLQSVMNKLEHPEEFMSKVRHLYEAREETSRDEISLKDGRTFDRYSAPMSGSDGTYYGRIWYFRDITELKRAKDELVKERDKAQSYFEIAGVMLVVLDREGRVAHINPKGCEILGYDRKDIIGADWFGTIVPARLRDEVKAVFLKLMAGSIKPVEYYENPVVIKTGVERTIAFHNTVVRDSTSQIIGILSSGEDITERRRAEEALRVAELRYRLLFDQSPNGIVVLDPTTGSFLEFNETACGQLGYSREEFARLRISDIEAQETPEDTERRIAKVMLEGRSDFETFQRTRQGEIRNVHVTAQFTEMLGRRVYHCVWHDVTEHKRLEAQYLHAQKMESIGTLAGGVAHDFNNILSAIIGYGHVTLMKMASDDPLRSNIEHILEAVDRAAHLTKELLLFSRKQVSERKPVDLNEVVSVAEKFVMMVIGGDIECKTTLQERSLPVYADNHRLEQVVMNLAINARDAMPGGGAFTLKTEQIDLAEDFTRAHGYGKAGSYAMITVSDTGAGMDEATQKRIFEPFFTTKEVGKGTGLGLAVAYGIIKDHEGFINVSSEPGRGATFRIYLPLIISKEVEKTAPRLENAPARGTETVLLAEDDASLREQSRKVLTEYGYTVIEAVDGEDAVKKFMDNKDTIQLLLFDLIMPKMNGKEASDEIRMIKPGTKVLFASGYDPDLIRQKALLGDGVQLIYKPVSPMDLLRRARSVLDGSPSR